MKLKEGGEMWLKRRREWSREAGVYMAINRKIEKENSTRFRCEHGGP